MALRINSSDGMVLHTTSRGRSGGVMSLSLSEGHLLLLLDGGRRKVSLRSRRKYNDDRWHTVSSHTLAECVMALELEPQLRWYTGCWFDSGCLPIMY